MHVKQVRCDCEKCRVYQQLLKAAKDKELSPVEEKPVNVTTKVWTN